MADGLYHCPRCGSYDVKTIHDYEINYTLFKCVDCHESFAVDNIGLLYNGIGWAFVEWNRAYKTDLAFNRVIRKVLRCFQ